MRKQSCKKLLFVEIKAHLCKVLYKSPLWLQQSSSLLHELLLQSKPPKNFEVFALLHSHFSKTS